MAFAYASRPALSSFKSHCTCILRYGAASPIRSKSIGSRDGNIELDSESLKAATIKEKTRITKTISVKNLLSDDKDLIGNFPLLGLMENVPLPFHVL